MGRSATLKNNGDSNVWTMWYGEYPICTATDIENLELNRLVAKNLYAAIDGGGPSHELFPMPLYMRVLYKVNIYSDYRDICSHSATNAKDVVETLMNYSYDYDDGSVFVIECHRNGNLIRCHKGVMVGYCELEEFFRLNVADVPYDLDAGIDSIIAAVTCAMMGVKYTGDE